MFWHYIATKTPFISIMEREIIQNVFTLQLQLPLLLMFIILCIPCRGVSKEDYSPDTYPPYCVGMGYIISSDILEKMMLIVPTQPLFVLEDVYVGLVLENLKIVPVDNRKCLQIHYDYSWDVCQHKDMLLSLEANPKQMLGLHFKFSQLTKCGRVDYV